MSLMDKDEKKNKQALKKKKKKKNNQHRKSSNIKNKEIYTSYQVGFISGMQGEFTIWKQLM